MGRHPQILQRLPSVENPMITRLRACVSTLCLTRHCPDLSTHHSAVALGLVIMTFGMR